MPPYLSSEDVELIKRVADGSEEAFTQLFQRYADKVWSTAFLLAKSKEVAQDIVQEVFTRMWTKRASLPSVVNLEAWLHVVARNLIYERLRKEALDEKYRQYIKAYFSDGPLGPDRLAEFKELDNGLQQAVLGLPPQLQRVFKLSRFKGMNHEEIARELGISRSTVKSYIVQAIVALRKALARYSARILVCICVIFVE